MNEVKLGRNVFLGEGTVLGAKPLNLEFVPGKNYRRRTKFCGEIVIEDDVNIGSNCVIVGGVDEPTRIKRHAWINHGSQIGHGAEIGERTVLGNGVIVLGKAIIGSDCYIAAGSIIKPLVKIGDRTMIGMGSVVTRNIPSGVIAYGNPCHIIRVNEWHPPQTSNTKP